MAFIKLINNIPVYTTMREALIWGGRYGVGGTHTHRVNNRLVYMPGRNHAQINEAMARIRGNTFQTQQVTPPVIPPVQPPVVPPVVPATPQTNIQRQINTPTSAPMTTSTVSTSGSSGGGGGGGGY
jgi:hypothetical protein